MSSLAARHEAFIRNILHDKFLLLSESFEIEPIETGKSNHVFLIKLIKPTLEPLDASNNLFTSPIPVGTSRLLLRIPRENVSLEDSARVRNEVAFLSLARDALSPSNVSPIPAVFGWSDSVSDSTFRWILEEWKAGETLTPERLAGFDDETQRFVLGQIATVLQSFQNYQLPQSVVSFGGLTFDDDGIIKSGISTIPCGGPFPSYREFLHGMCLWQLAASERSTHLKGWREYPKLRKRLDALFADGLDELIAKVPLQKPTLVHADLDLPNLLFDPTTHRLTAVLDFDFSHIGAPISEHLFSFLDLNALLSSEANPSGATRKWLLSGFPQKVDSKFRLGKLWDAILSDANVQRPSTIEEASHMADIWWFSQELCQAYWFMDRIVGKKSAEEIETLKSSDARKLEKYLKFWGF
ncbi:hypothetical protein QQS21_000873 [Conoideocrella luteorostrata]|uniref:Aminoglycoside phosphotransferase domain-containing protein n=1 Tax=Conoideocrella luteorostrata TaxID=1105319 RepID=A0AAJ0G3S8_9HYPO|nr:hypothetical protein QQS21_000873 [Conoideocrella luteorostrata]